MYKAFGIINFAGNHIQVNGVQDYRPVGAFSFLGRYRIIDFPISNMSNSGIDNIQVYVRRKPRSLTEHLGTGRHYNINSKRGKLNIMYAEDGQVGNIYSTDIAAYIDNLDCIERMSQPYVVIAPSYMIYTADYSEFLNAHVESGADIVPRMRHAQHQQAEGRALHRAQPRKCKEPEHLHGYLCHEQGTVPGPHHKSAQDILHVHLRGHPG